jgi:hypothetical protein
MQSIMSEIQDARINNEKDDNTYVIAAGFFGHTPRLVSLNERMSRLEITKIAITTGNVTEVAKRRL